MTSTRMRTIVAAFMVAALGGCGDDLTVPEPGTDLAVARQRWNAQRPRAYTFTLARSCFCIGDARRPTVITVRDGVVVDRRYADTGVAVDARWAELYPSIDGLFAIIDDARARAAERLDLAFDATLGYPTRIDIDYSTRVADEEVAYTVTGFRVP